MLLIVAILGAFFIYALIVKPEYVAVVFFTITIADMNASVEGLPVNLRALMGLALFARTLVPMKTEDHDAFFYTPAKHIVIFLLYTMALSEFYDLLTFEYARTCALTFISAYTGYYFFYKYNDTRLLKISLYIAGVICFSDLVYTYAREGEFPVLRIYKTLLGIPEQLNSRRTDS